MADKYGIMNSSKQDDNSTMYLVVQSGTDREQVFPLSVGSIRIGRWPTSDIIIHDERIARNQCLITYDGAKVIVENNNSTHPTLLNGTSITKSEFIENDTLQIGRTLILLVKKESVHKLNHNNDYYMATKDMITGLLSREHILNRAEDELALDNRLHTPTSIIFIRIQDFASLQSQYGNDVTNILLQQAARVCEHELRVEDFIGRYTEDTFMVFPRGEITEEGISILCNRLLHALTESSFTHNNTDIPVFFSIGFTIQFISETTTLYSLIQDATQSLHNAQESGVNIIQGPLSIMQNEEQKNE